MRKQNVVQVTVPDAARTELKRRAAALFMAEGAFARSLLLGALARLANEEHLGGQPRRTIKTKKEKR